MRIAVFGLGYVGSVTAACLAKLGHTVVGVDVSEPKVRMINNAESPIAERGLAALISRAVRARRLRATQKPVEAVERADVTLIAVGTPSGRNGAVNLNEVRAVVQEIGFALRKSPGYRTIALRSTVPPGTTAKVVIPILERASRRKAGRDFGVAFHPEFLREGSSVYDFFHPTRTVIGRREAQSAKALLKLWKPVRAPLILTSLETAEMVKYADNSFHALKVCFANEIGSISSSLGVDPQEVMEIFRQDSRLNISPLYLKPGFPFGGPCLPKDVRALYSFARRTKTEAPLIQAIPASNASHLSRAIESVLASGRKKICVLGLGFKSNTDDLRESPSCSLVVALLRAERLVKVYDPNVDLARLLGANRAYIQTELPSLPSLIANTIDQALKGSEVVVIACEHPEFRARTAKLKSRQLLIDLVRMGSATNRHPV